MNFLLTLTEEARLAGLFVLGVVVATQINRAIYRMAWFPRWIGPWSPAHAEAAPRRAIDRLPIVGWWFLRRESSIHGAGYWIRPMLLELSVGLAFAGLYWHEVVKFGINGFDPGTGVLHGQCFSHLLLLSLMLVATFIDFDEQTIPDAITLPGTLCGLAWAALFPMSRTLVAVPAPLGYAYDFLHIGSGTAMPADRGWPVWLDGTAGLALGITCLLLWCVAIMPWIWTTRRGWVKAVQFAVASLRRGSTTWPLALLGLAGSAVIAGVWLVGGPRWESLLSSLVGMVVGGGTIWAVRIVGTQALGQEAMGFGDVTLMAMIGTFTGWQPTVIIFFLAPFSAVLIAVAQFIFTRRHDIAFGPYLCLGTLVWLLNSNTLWKNYGLPIFSMGWIVPAIGMTGLVLMGGLLAVWRSIRDRLLPIEEDGAAAESAAIPEKAPDQ